MLCWDLNPASFELLKGNIEHFISKSPNILNELEIKNIDARKWKDELGNEHKIDYLLVNLPHHSIEHLPELLPLLSTEHSTVIRGWAIIDRDSLALQEGNITSMIELAGGNVEYIRCSEVKGFSSSKIFMRFESWQTFS